MGNHRRSCAIASAVIAAAVLLAACTSDAKPASPTGSPTFPIRSATGSPSPGVEQTSASPTEKCAITTQASVARILGAKRVSESVGVTGIGGPMCRFTLSSSNVGVPGTVTVTLSARTPVAEFVRGQRSAPGAIAISKVGHRAYYVPAMSTLVLIKNGKRVVLQARVRVPGGTPLKPAVLRADLVRLGRSIAAGL